MTLGKSTKRRNWQEARGKVEREGECRQCGSRLMLEAAHVIPRSTGGEQGEHSTVPLCRDCHSLYDGGRLDLLPALTYAEQAEAVRLVGIARALERISPEHNPKRTWGVGFPE